MKICIYNWAFEREAYDKLIEIGYAIPAREYSIVIDGDMFEIAKKMYEAGLNVMLYHNKGGEFPVIFVDTKKFGQR